MPTDSINQAQARLEAINSEIKKAEENKAFKQIEAESIQKNIDFLNQNLEQRKLDTKNFEENYKFGQTQLKDINQQIKDKEVELVKLEKDSTDQIRKQVNSLNAEIKRLEENKSNLIKENEVMGNKIVQISQDISQSKIYINDLEKQKNNFQDLIKNEIKKGELAMAETDKKKGQLLSYSSQVEEIRLNIEKIKLEYSELEMERERIKKEIKELADKKIEAQKEFDTLCKKSQILIDRTEFQNGQEIYLKEQFEKIGRVYQPYQQ